MQNNNTNNNMATGPSVGATPRICATFDPSRYLSAFVYDNGTQESYLEVKYRVMWAQCWAMEHRVNLQILEQDVTFVPELRMLFATCIIKIDDVEAARGTAGRYVPEDVSGMNSVVQSVATCAKGRALANLGFGTLNCSVSEVGDNLPPESGMSIPKGSAPVAQSQTTINPYIPAAEQSPIPVEVNEAPITASVVTASVADPDDEQDVTPEPPKPRRGRKPKTASAVQGDPEQEPEAPAVISAPVQAPAVQPIPGVEIPQTVEAARAFICPIGLGKGRPMGDLYLTDRGKVEFFASDRFASADRHPGLVAAAKLLMAQG